MVTCVSTSSFMINHQLLGKLSEFVYFQVQSLFESHKESLDWLSFVVAFTLQQPSSTSQSRTMALLSNTVYYCRWKIVRVNFFFSLFLPYIYKLMFFLWSRNSPLCQHVPCQERGSPPACCGPWSHLPNAPAMVATITDGWISQSEALCSKRISLWSRSLTLDWDFLIYCCFYECIKMHFIQVSVDTKFRYFKCLLWFWADK